MDYLCKPSQGDTYAYIKELLINKSKCKKKKKKIKNLSQIAYDYSAVYNEPFLINQSGSNYFLSSIKPNMTETHVQQQKHVKATNADVTHLLVTEVGNGYQGN